jgi:RNAse (barnase) inhibitor barstar
MQRRSQQLDALWSSLQKKDWRAYASVEYQNSTPRKSFANPIQEVIEVFDFAEKASTKNR